MEIQEESNISTYLPGYESVKNYAQDAFKAIVAATKAATALPDGGRDYEYYRSFSDFRALMKEEGKVILSAMSCLTKSQGIKKSFEDLNVEEAFELLAGINDTILENADIALDNATGNKAKEQLPEDLVVASVRTPMPINTSWNKIQTPSPKGQTIRLLSAKNIQRPQMRFKEKIDNSNSPFVPIIKWKPNSIKPLAILPEIIDGKEEYGHPYEWEIEKFKPAEGMLEPVEPVEPIPIEDATHFYVENEDQLKKMCDDLRKQKEIAIDLEHHSFRSFQGIVCLMQISTRTTDYIVDTLRLRSELEILNEVFTDPKVVKVLHGADMDIVWLQRDFGLYVVNMFDTGQAARVLNFAHFSLAYMLKHYCKVETNKAFQLADWRIRPLPAEMIKYAREDTHYLLYIYDCMKNDLLQKGNEVKNLLHAAFQRSKVICFKVYQKPVFHEDSYLELYRKSKKVFNARQLFALKELYSWRDTFAREEDESTGYVLPNHMLLQIAEILPREQQGILACCNPIPPVVRHQLNDVHSIVLKARDSAISVFTEESTAPRPPEINVDVDLESILHCPHDIHHHHEETMHLGTLFGGETSQPQSSTGISIKQKLSLPLVTQKKTKKKSCPKYEEAIQALKSYLSPFERYKLVKRFNVAYDLGDEDDVSESDRIHKINDQLKRLAAVADPEGGEDDLLAQRAKLRKSAAADSTPVVTSKENQKKQEITPLRKKDKKKKHKRQHGDESLAAEAKSAIPPEDATETPPAKKAKTPENASRSQDEDRGPKSKKKTSGSDGMKPNSDVEYLTPPSSKLWRKKKHSKQATFGSSSSKAHSEKKNWPSR